MGTAFTYQGFLVDGSGPCTGYYDFRFTLYDQEAGGSQVGPMLTFDSTSAIYVEDGQFVVALDFDTGVFAGHARWLFLEVRESGVGSYIALSPRQELTPAPYAIYAENTRDAVPPGAIVMWSGALADIPDGWALCDGSAGTPDLRDRFIQGWTDAVDPGDTGGSASHSHSGTSHSHTAQIWADYYWQHQGTVLGRTGGTWSVDVAAAPWGGNWGYDVMGSMNNWTQITLMNQGGGPYSNVGYKDMLGVNGDTDTASVPISTESHLPPYYKLAFIMKL
jgi:hypothetical protein